MSNIQRNIPTAVRILLGLAFTVFGLNGFLGFLPMPPHPGAGGAFLGALGATGYMFPLIKGTELVAGLLLLGNRFVPLALTLLAPVLVNILAFHAFLDLNGTGLVVTLLAAELFLAWRYRDAFAPMLKARVLPTQASVGEPKRAPSSAAIA